LDNSTGTSDLVISDITSSNPLFHFGLRSFPITISAGGSLALPIVFGSAATGTEVSDITIESNDCNDLTYSFSIQNASGTISCPPVAVTPIPTMGEWGLICLSLLFMIFGIVSIKQPYYAMDIQIKNLYS